MAYRQCFKALLTRQFPTILTSNSHSLEPLTRLSLQSISHNFVPKFNPQLIQFSNFSTRSRPPNNPKFSDAKAEDEEGGGETSNDDDDDEEEYDEEESDIDGNEERQIGQASSSNIERAYSVEEKIKEAAEIGYRVIGPLESSDRVFKRYEPVFAVVQIGSHQFKVSNGDWIYTERLKYCEVNDKLILNKVLLLGSQNQTIIGRPLVPDAAVHAVVEEHALDAKVIIFKKKRRKNYRRTNGHRQELTRLRITDIQGIEKPEKPLGQKKKEKASGNMMEKIAVAA
ncbi:hypothetical protein Dimus_032746 [Dionaea muscipula]